MRPFTPCERCGGRTCLRFGTLAPGYPCGLANYADFVWIVPLFIVAIPVLLVRYAFMLSERERSK